jgi:CBS domain-containing protein
LTRQEKRNACAKSCVRDFHACPGETGLDVFKRMSKYETGRVVVIDPTKKNKILGIVTKSDLMDALIKQPVPT